MDDPKEILRTFVFEELLAGSNIETVPDELDMIESGLLDSIAIVQLIRFVEATFAITVDEADVDAANFSCLNSLNDFIQKKRFS